MDTCEMRELISSASASLLPPAMDEPVRRVSDAGLRRVRLQIGKDVAVIAPSMDRESLGLRGGVAGQDQSGT